MAPLRTASLYQIMFPDGNSILWVLQFLDQPGFRNQVFFLGDHFWINHSGVLIMFKLKVHEQIWPMWWSTDTEPIYNDYKVETYCSNQIEGYHYFW
jgi:hypothetical protein